MKNVYKLLIVLVAVVFAVSGLVAQNSDGSPAIKKQTNQKVKAEKFAQDYKAIIQSEQSKSGELSVSANSIQKVIANELKKQGNESAYFEFLQNAKKPANYKPITLNIKGATAYAFVAYDPSSVLPLGPAYFDVDDPGTIASLAPSTANDFIAGGSWAEGVWYGSEYGTGALYTMDPSSGAMTLVGYGSAPGGLHALAYDPSTFTMYGCNYGASSGLYTVDLTNGATTLIGDVGIGALVIGMACDASGNLFGADLLNDVLISIDKSTGAGTVIGSLGILINYAQDLEYDNENDVLYLAGYTSTGQLYTIDPSTGAATYIGDFQGGTEMCGLAFEYTGVQYTNDVGIQSILSPASGVNLGNEVVTVRVKNFGTATQSNFDISYTMDGGAPVTVTITTPIAGGTFIDYTFTGTVDLTAYGTYNFEACTYLAGDENATNDCKTKAVTNDPPSYCDASTLNEDEYIGNVTCGDINNTTGFQAGVGDYTYLSTLVIPAASVDITVINGGNLYSSDMVTCWVDWNDNYEFEQGGEEEFILLNVGGAGEIFTGAITVPADALGGEHTMRVRMTYFNAPTPCGESSYGEIEDYTLFVGGLEFGHVTGNVLLTGIAPYNMGDVTEVTIAGGTFTTHPDASGYYDLTIYPGTYNITASLYGYTGQIVPGVVIDEGATVSGIDFTLPCIYGRIWGTITDEVTSAPIENASVKVLGTDFETFTAADGTYELFIEAGTYDLKANHPTYMAEVAEDVVVTTETDTQLDFALTYQEACQFSVVLWDDYGDGWNDGTLTISVDDEVVLDNITLAGGTGPETYYFEVGTGSDVTCVFVAGGWGYECSYYIYNNDNEEVFADGVGGVEPIGGTFTATCIIFIYGDLAGTVTDLATGTPVQGAEILIDDLTGITGADGTYLIENVMIGTWDVYCEAEGYNPEMVSGVVILEDLVTTQDFVLAAPGIVVAPLAITEELDIGETTDVLVNISNPGLGNLEWDASLSILTDDAWDLQLSFDLEAATGAPGNAGAECDGEFFYSTRWATNLIHKYDLEGNLIEEFSIPGVTGLRDLAFDGTHMFGGAAANTIYEMDFVNKVLIGTISSPQQVRSIAYDEGADAFWCANWDTDITLVSKAGVALNTLPAATHNLAGMYGTAYDNWTSGGPYLWIFDQGSGAGTAQIIYQANLSNLTMTGFSYDVMSDLGPNDGAIAGGLFTIPNLVSGTVSIGGLIQGTPDMFFLYELAPFSTWISISPTSGSLASMANEDMTVHLDATEIIIPGVYEAEIHFASEPNVGSPVVYVTLTVAGLIPAVNLAAGYECTDVELTWEMPTGGNPDSWNVYKDGILLGNTTVMQYNDPMVMPGVAYTYHVTAVYEGEESMASVPATITVPIPGSLQPIGLSAEANNPSYGYVTLDWNEPNACLEPDGYDVYRDGVKINTSLVTNLTYVDGPLPAGLYPYKLKAVYYFGESGFSTTAYALIPVGIEEVENDQLKIYPNPASQMVNVESQVEITGIKVYNNSGQIVLDEQVKVFNHQIDVSGYDKGIYFISLETMDGNILKKITIN